MWYLKRPFEGSNFEELKENILTKDIDPIPEFYSQGLKVK